MDYEPDYSRYTCTETRNFLVNPPYTWICDTRIWEWPSSDGGVTFRVDKRVEPFGSFKTIWEAKPE